MTNQKDIFHTDIMKIRIMDIEYDGITEDEIRRIYYEETGKHLDVAVDIYYSEDYIDEVEANGFNGTMIHLFDEKLGINEIYTITRGTELTQENDWRPIDWVYNLMGIFVGENIEQFEAAKKFDEEVTSEIQLETGGKVKKIGLGHSLGGNLITLLQIVLGYFDDVYTVNAAPPSFYQLANIDNRFALEIAEIVGYDPNDPHSIYSIDPKQLEEFAEVYYEEAGKNIHHITTEQDILQAIFSLRGFFRVGDYLNPVDAFPGEDVESLSKLFERLPDDFVKSIQEYLAKNIADVYNEEGFDGFINELLGLDAEMIDKIVDINEGKISKWKKITLIPGFVKMVNDVWKKIPDVITFLKILNQDIPEVLSTLEELGYISEVEAEVLEAEIDGLIHDLQGMYKKIDGMFSNSIFLVIPQVRAAAIPVYVALAIDLKLSYDRVRDRIDNILKNTEYFQEQLANGVDAHALSTTVNAVEKDGKKSYSDSGDMYVHKVVNGERIIKINFSAAMRIYNQGLMILQIKEEKLRKMERHYHEDYLNDYEERRMRLISKMNDMEMHPYKYQHLVGQYTRDTQLFYRLVRIDVHEQIAGIPYSGFQDVFDNLFATIQMLINHQREILHKVKVAIEDMFNEESELARYNYQLREA